VTRARAAAPATRLGSSDCEHLRDGVLAQPVNALSSAAFVLAGGVVAAWASARPDLRHDLAAGLSVGLVAAGLGSIDYHGPQGPVSAICQKLSEAYFAPLLSPMRTHRSGGTPISFVQMS